MATKECNKNLREILVVKPTREERWTRHSRSEQGPPFRKADQVPLFVVKSLCSASGLAPVPGNLYLRFKMEDVHSGLPKDVHEIKSAVLDDELELTNNGKQQL